MCFSKNGWCGENDFKLSRLLNPYALIPCWCGTKQENQNISRTGVRASVFTEGFLRLVTLKSLGLIPWLERMEIIFNNHEVENLFNGSYQISQPMYMNYPNIWLEVIRQFTQIVRARGFGEGWSITQNEKNESTLIEILDWCDLVGAKFKKLFLINPCFEEKEGREWRGMKREGKREEGRGGRMRNKNGEMVVCVMERT